MTRIKPGLIGVSLALVSLSLWVGWGANEAGQAMTTAAARLLGALDDSQRGQLQRPFDDPERLNWHFIPRARAGLPIGQMTPAQRALAFGLLQAGLSDTGGVKATTIMSLEAILRELEADDGQKRNPELYYVSIFGDPASADPWGWRIEGHHLSLNFVLDEGQVIASTPTFFGANPASVPSGPQAGLRALAEVEDRAFELLNSLDESQRTSAVVAAKAPADVESNTGAGQEGVGGGLATRPPSLELEGISVRALSDTQKQLLKALIGAYAQDMPDEVATTWLTEVERSGEHLSFAWYGELEPGQPHAYQVQGRGFQIEFNNTQNKANHIHSVWRTTMSDFGQETR